MTADRGQWEEWLSARLDGALSEDESRRLARILETSEEARSYEQRLAEAVEVLRSVEPIEAREGLLASLDERLRALESESADGAGSDEPTLTIPLDIPDDIPLANDGEDAGRDEPAGLPEDLRELISASFEDALTPGESERLAAILEQEPEARAFHERLSGWREALPKLDLVDPSVDFLERIHADLEVCAELEREELTDTARRESRRQMIATARSWSAQGLRVAAAILVVFGAFWFLRVTLERSRRHDVVAGGGGRTPVTPPDETPGKDPIPKPGDGSTEKSVVVKRPDVVTPKDGKPQDPTPPARRPDDTTPEQTPDEPKQVPDKPPRGTPKEGSREREPGSTKPRELDLAALERHLAAIADPATAPGARLGHLKALGDFPHERTEAFLEKGLTGGFDNLGGARELYQAGPGVLARLDSAAAARVLWGCRIWDPSLKLDPVIAIEAVEAFRDKDALAFFAEATLEDRSAGVAADQRVHAVIAGLAGGGQSPAGEAYAALFKGLSRRKLGRRAMQHRYREALVAMGRIDRASGKGEAFALLAKLATEREPRSAILVREGAAVGLGYVDHPERLETLATVIDDASTIVRVGAARSLARTRKAAAVRLLVKRLGREKRSNSRARTALSSALFELTGRSFSTVEAWKGWLSRNSSIFDEDGGDGTLQPPGTVALESGLASLPGCGRATLFVLDASASMAHGGKFRKAKEELARALRALPKGTVFNVHVFSDTGKRLLYDARRPLLPATPANVEAAITALAKQRVAARPTDLGRAFEKALATPGIDTLVLLSDGMQTADGGRSGASLLFRVEQLNRRSRVVLHTVGIYSARDLFLDLRERTVGDEGRFKGFLRELSQRNGGFFASNLEKDLKKKAKAPK